MANKPRMRPVFTIELETDGADVLRTLDALVKSGVGGLVGQVLPSHAVLQLPPERQSMLSPFLNLELADSDGGAVLRGRFSPHPNVWTGFLAIYGALGMVALTCAMYGLSQWWIGHSAWVLLGVPGSLGAIAFVYGAAVIGQGLVADEMYDLRALVDRAVRESASA
jgi:hypothetical protein